MRIGDKILCKKNYIFKASVITSMIESFLNSKLLFKKDNYYTITVVLNSGFVVTTEWKEFTLTEKLLNEYFYTPNELRKQKLNKLKKSH